MILDFDIDMEEYLAEHRYTATMAADDLRGVSKRYADEIAEELQAVTNFENSEEITEEVIKCAKSILHLAGEFCAELQDVLDCAYLERVVCLRKENAELRVKLQEETL